MDELTITVEASEDDFLTDEERDIQNEKEEGEISETDSEETTDKVPYVAKTIEIRDNEQVFKCGIEYVCIIEHIDPEYDVYIGGETLSHHSSIWKNPFEFSHKSSMIEMFKEYEEYIRSDKELFSQLHQLCNKRIACW